MNEQGGGVGMFIKQAIIAIALALFMLVAILDQVNAKDFGNQGHVFNIQEEDILEVIKKQLSKVDLDAFNAQILKKTIDHVENPPAVVGISNYTKDKNKEKEEYYYDPTYILDKDIYDTKGNVLHYRGTKVNPLEFVPLREALIFIDGDNEDQLKLALDIRNQKSKIDKRIKIILTKGSPLKIQRKHKIWIYFDQRGILTSKLGIKQVPALVEQYGLLLKIRLIDTGEYFK
jgi:conjugal transfer pilus assembly protein TraW